MNTTQLAEMSLIIGNLEGIASVLEMVDDIEPQKFKKSITDVKDRVLVLRDQFTQELIENEKGKAKNTKTVIISKTIVKKPIKKTEEKQK